MSVIVPTIMAETVDQLQQSTQILQTFVRRVHIDISDGEFAPTFLLNEGQLFWPQGWQVDVHAMVARPSEHIAQLMQLKPSMVIFHAETQEDLVPHLNALKQAGIRAGVALLRTTVPASVQPAIEAADHVMIFSGELGKFGGTASMMQLEKIRLIKKIKPDVEIGWDGGVKIENAYSISKGGVDVLNVGGEIANATSPVDAYNELVKEINKQGVI
jgi:ribulose-phosphate 3-epimerase